MPNLGPTELIIILVIVILIFGAGRLSGLGGALGKTVKDFRQAVTDGQESDEDTSDDEAPEEEPEPTASEGNQA